MKKERKEEREGEMAVSFSLNKQTKKPFYSLYK